MPTTGSVPDRASRLEPIHLPDPSKCSWASLPSRNRIIATTGTSTRFQSEQRQVAVHLDCKGVNLATISSTSWSVPIVREIGTSSKSGGICGMKYLNKTRAVLVFPSHYWNVIHVSSQPSWREHLQCCECQTVPPICLPRVLATASRCQLPVIFLFVYSLLFKYVEFSWFYISECKSSNATFQILTMIYQILMVKGEPVSSFQSDA